MTRARMPVKECDTPCLERGSGMCVRASFSDVTSEFILTSVNEKEEISRGEYVFRRKVLGKKIKKNQNSPKKLAVGLGSQAELLEL
jgi:hypothetical protein